MTPNRDAATPRWFAWSLATIALLGLALRFVYDTVNSEKPLVGDGFYYHYGAALVADGKEIHQPARVRAERKRASERAAPSRVGSRARGPSWLGFDSVLQHQLIASVIGVATVVLIGLIGNRLAGPRAGLIAAGIAALYPNLWLYERELLSEPLIFLEVAVIILLAYRFQERPRASTAIALGVAAGFLVLSRSEQMLLFPVLVIPLVAMVHASWMRRFALLAIIGATAVVIIAPWPIYNSSRFEDRVLFTNQFGSLLSAANCPDVYYGPYIGYRSTDCRDAITVGKTGRQNADESSARSCVGSTHSPTPATTSRACRSLRWRVRAARSECSTRSSRPASTPHAGARLWVTRLGLFAYWFIAAAAVLGATTLVRRKVPVWPLLAMILAVAISVLISFGQTRSSRRGRSATGHPRGHRDRRGHRRVLISAGRGRWPVRSTCGPRRRPASSDRSALEVADERHLHPVAVAPAAAKLGELLRR